MLTKDQLGQPPSPPSHSKQQTAVNYSLLLLNKLPTNEVLFQQHNTTQQCNTMLKWMHVQSADSINFTFTLKWAVASSDKICFPVNILCWSRQNLSNRDVNVCTESTSATRSERLFQILTVQAVIAYFTTFIHHNENISPYKIKIE